MAKAFAAPPWQRALVALTGGVLGALIIGVLYWAQVIFIPVALAIFLTFLLNPFVLRLQRRGLGRIPSVILVVLAAMLVLGGAVWLVTYELASLADELPKYTQNIKTKIKSLRETGEKSVYERFRRIVEEIGLEQETKSDNAEGTSAERTIENSSATPAQPPTVVMQPQSPPWLSRVQGYISPAFELIGQLGLAAILVVFMLLGREDLRDRLIRLVGHGRITVTTKALDDAGHRISRFLLMQVVINGTYGLILSAGLLIIGVKYAWLWGFLAVILRYVPYIGTWVAASLPIGLSFALFEGWLQPLAVIGFFVVLELVSANIMEPWLYGHSIGVSQVAFLIAAAFWTFLWGPVGLVLSAPLTVCLVVLGKFVPQLEFLDVLLGDQPALNADVRYYQRALARDQDEATDIVLEQVTETSSEQVYDDLLIPALAYARRDRERGNITEADEDFLLRVTRETAEVLGEQAQQEASAETSKMPSDGAETTSPRVRILGCAAQDEADALALEMLRQLLAPKRWELDVVSVGAFSSELLAHVEETRPALICIASLPPGGLAHTRYLCKRLRARFPEIKIVVGRWGLKANLEQNQASLQEAGADWIGTTLRETRIQMNGWFPVLSSQAETSALVQAG